VEAFISKGFNSLKLKWKLKYGVGCKILASQDIGFLQYKFYDNMGNEINLKKELEKRKQIIVYVMPYFLVNAIGESHFQCIMKTGFPN